MLHVHEGSDVGRVDLFVWIQLGSVLASGGPMHHSHWYRLVGVAGRCNCRVGSFGRTERGSCSPVERRRASQGPTDHSDHLGNARYFLFVSQVLVFPSLWLKTADETRETKRELAKRITFEKTDEKEAL